MTNVLSHTVNVATIISSESGELSESSKALLNIFLVKIGIDYVIYTTTSTSKPGTIQISLSDFGHVDQARHRLSLLLEELTFEAPVNSTDITLILAETGLVTNQRMITCGWNQKKRFFEPVTVDPGKALFSEPMNRPTVDPFAGINLFDDIDEDIRGKILARQTSPKVATKVLFFQPQ